MPLQRFHGLIPGLLICCGALTPAALLNFSTAEQAPQVYPLNIAKAAPATGATADANHGTPAAAIDQNASDIESTAIARPGKPQRKKVYPAQHAYTQCIHCFSTSANDW